jgi:aryl-alcohol dehydrogenase-like predicted oxidoreductase
LKHREVGKSGVLVSTIGMGCWAFGGGAYWGDQSQEDVDAVVRAALDRGANFFDTAEVYNNGESEKSLGKALKGRRAEAVVCSKISPPNAVCVRKSLEASLRRLGTDYLDIYMLHWPINPLALQHFTSEKLESPPTIAGAYSQLADLKKEGLIRCIGMSNFGAAQMAEVIATGVQVDFNQITYNIVSRAIEAEVVPFCEKNGVSIIGTMALQQGLLSGKYQKAEDVPPHQAHSRHFKQERGGAESRHGEAGAEAEIFGVVAALRELSAATGYTPGDLAIAWVLNKPFITSTLVGSRNIAQFEANMKAADIVLPADVMRRIDEASLPALKKLGNSPDYFESREKSRIY